MLGHHRPATFSGIWILSPHKKKCQSWIPFDKTFWICTWTMSKNCILRSIQGLNSKGKKLIIHMIPFNSILKSRFQTSVYFFSDIGWIFFCIVSDKICPFTFQQIGRENLPSLIIFFFSNLCSLIDSQKNHAKIWLAPCVTCGVGSIIFDKIVQTKMHLTLDMWFTTMWHFDKCRLRQACAASF